MSRRVAFWLALPLTLAAFALIALMLACIVLSIWGDPDLSGRYAASAFVCAFTTIAIGGAAGFLWIQWEYAPGRAA